MRTLTSRSRAALAAVGTVAFGVAAVGFGAPAYADEGDSPLCYASTGSVTVQHAGSDVSSVPYGTDLSVNWSVYAYCQDYAIYMTGPGFSYEESVWSGPRGVWATPPNGSHSMTWTLEMRALDATSTVPWTLATRTVTVT